MRFDLYVWHAPRDLAAEQAATMLEAWESAGADPQASPFDPSTEMGWFHRELHQDAPDLELLSDAAPSGRSTPIWLSGTDEAPARIVAVRLSPGTARDDLEAVLSLAVKYDLVLYDARSGLIHRPLEAMSAHASATFWPDGAIQAAVAGGIGGAVAVVAWTSSIPVLSGIAAVIGGFMAVMSILVFVQEGRKRLRQDPR